MSIDGEYLDMRVSDVLGAVDDLLDWYDRGAGGYVNVLPHLHRLRIARLGCVRPGPLSDRMPVKPRIRTDLIVNSRRFAVCIHGESDDDALSFGTAEEINGDWWMSYPYDQTDENTILNGSYHVVSHALWGDDESYDLDTFME